MDESWRCLSVRTGVSGESLAELHHGSAEVASSGSLLLLLCVFLGRIQQVLRWRIDQFRRFLAAPQYTKLLYYRWENGRSHTWRRNEQGRNVNEGEEGGECKKKTWKLCERRMGLRRGERLAALVRHCLSASLASLIPSVKLSERFDFAFFVLPASGPLMVNRKLMNHPGRRNLSVIGWIRGQGSLREVKIRLVPLYFGFRGSLEFSFYRVELTLMSIFRVSFVAFMTEGKIFGYFLLRICTKF